MSGSSDDQTGRLADDEMLAGTLPVSDGAAAGDAPPVVIGRFRVEGLLGRGAMGAVYAAFDPSLGRRVAIKVLHVGETAIDARIRLVREAQALARFTHPNIVVIHEVGELGEQIFLVMELVEGETLGEWLRRAPRDWREALGLFLQAGRGLAAAHAAGIIHRDFKPANVLVGRDGRVRVGDFGLARGAGDTAPEDERPGSPASLSPMVTLTAAGAVVGTPAYMAPEQRGGTRASPLADQFSFCMSLHEGLLGVRPGSQRPSRSVPAGVRRVIERGLREDPAARHPSMDALLDALEAAARGSARLWIAAGAVAALAAGGALWAATRADPCAGVEGLLAGVWDAPRRAEVRRAFQLTRMPYAPSSLATAERALDRYAASWVDRRRALCRAAESGGEPRDVVDARGACLDQRLEDLRGLAGVYAAADGTVVAQAAEAASTLSEPASCELPRGTAQPVPQDAALRAKVVLLRGKLLAREAQDRVGKYDLPATEALVGEARALGYKPVEIEAQSDLAWALFSRDELDRAAEILESVRLSAEEERYDFQRARSWVWLASLRGTQGRFDDAHAAERYADAMLKPMGREADWLRIQAERTAGLILSSEGRPAEAVPRMRHALELTRAKVQADDNRVARMSVDLAAVLDESGQQDEAEIYFIKALDYYSKAGGTQNPTVGKLVNNLAGVAYHRNDYQRALELYCRALAIKEASLNLDNLGIGYTTFNIGETLRQQRRFGEAVPYYRRACAIFGAKLGAKHKLTADAWYGLGDSLLESRSAEAGAALEKALALRTQAGAQADAVDEVKTALARARH